MTKPNQDCNFKPGTIWIRDNLEVMRGINSNTIDLIYLDPPFNTNPNYSAPIGSEEAEAHFKNIWTLDDVSLAEHGELAERAPEVYEVIKTSGITHGRKMKAYLIAMSIRLLEMHRILKDTGSVYLHCDPSVSHYLKLVMDAIFSHDNFRNEIVWCYTGPKQENANFGKQHDTVLFYTKSDKATFNSDAVRIKHKRQKPSSGRGMASGGRTFAEIRKNEQEQLKKGKVCPDWWTGAGFGSGSHMSKKERTGYPTQKPLALLDRIIKASTNEGDIVFDPFCGCATAPIAADRLNRPWIGCDLSVKAVELVEKRHRQGKTTNRPTFFKKGKCNHLTEPPKRTDNGQKVTNKEKTELRWKLYGQQEGDCVGCKIHFPFKAMQIDHILPTARGGQDVEDNFQLMCGPCNSSKGDQTMAEWQAKKAKEAKS